MSANLGEIALFASSSAVNLLSLPTLTSIGGISVDTTIEEAYEDTLEATEHPVEAGTQITDHSFKRPMEVVLRCGWSDSSIAALAGAVSNIASSLFGLGSTSQSSGSFTGGAMAASDYIAGIYSQLLQLQESRQTFALSTGMRSYDAMLLMSIRVRRDQSTRYVLLVEAVCRQMIIVSTQTATLPAASAQTFPDNTAEAVDAGSQQLLTGSPNPGGAFPPGQWVPNP